jgi:hypothetical protein
MRNAFRPVGLTIALIILLFVPAGVANADDIAWKAAHDTDPHLPLTPEQLQMTAQKRSAEHQGVSGSTVPSAFDAGALAGTDGTALLYSTCGTSCGGGGSYPSSASLIANQTPQMTSYYCGPAAVHEALGALGVSLSQSAAATALHTTTSGTAWSGGGTSPSGYPVPDVLNRYQGRNYYVPQPVSSPTSSAINTYEYDLEANISSVRAPVVGDAWEVPGGYHLVGHPSDHTIFHWFEIRGYYGSGGTSLYEDSVHGATSIAWSGNVPAYSNLPSYEIVSIVSGRGYVW